MPGWHEQTKDLVASGELVLLGVTQEQHAERCRLFAQWKGLRWPILHDPINLLESSAVPVVVAIDEHGVVRSMRPDPKWVRETFVKTDYGNLRQSGESPKNLSKDADELIAKLLEEGKHSPSVAVLRELGDAYALWKPNQPSLAVDAYRRAVLQAGADARHHFRLGVALRHRHDSSDRKATDFQEAVQHWTKALELNPNQYIWRRRIQQYGPRLTKPYPFYDWVPHARNEIAERGETPIELDIELSGAEIAGPEQSFQVHDTSQTSPDPSGRITRDFGQYVHFNAVTVPAAIKRGESVRLHLQFTLAPKRAHWNNESDPLRVWIETSGGWQAAESLLSLPSKLTTAESSEERRLEVEILSPLDAESTKVHGYALYYVCDNRTGECLLRRQDFVVDVQVK